MAGVGMERSGDPVAASMETMRLARSVDLEMTVEGKRLIGRGDDSCARAARIRSSGDEEFFPARCAHAKLLLRQTGAAKNALAIAVMLHLRAPYVSKTAILGCWVYRSGQKSKSRLNSKDLDRLVSS
jgi:hypothetical protein